MSKQQKVARVSYSDEHPYPLYYDEHGNRIADVSEPAPYKPMYDIEVGSKSPNYPERTHNEFHVYFDIHKEIAHFKAKVYLLGYLKAIRKILLHKYIWRHFS